MAIFETFKSQFFYCSFLAILAESLGVFQAFFISYMIEFIRTPSMPYYWGAIYVLIFFLANVGSVLLRNNYIYLGMVHSIRMRRTLVNHMLSKVGRLTMRSMS